MGLRTGRPLPNWNQVLNEISGYQRDQSQRAKAAVDIVRRKYLKKLHGHTGRNIIAYYSGFLSKGNIAGTDLVDEDKNGLMMAIHRLDKTKGLDLMLHTPGGRVATAETMVHYLKQMFGTNIRAIVPQIAMSAGTMIACACKKILMAKHSNLGPIDPHLNGVPAAGVMVEFKRAVEDYKKDPDYMAFWEHVIKQYPPSFLNQCENAVLWASNFVQTELENNMLAALPTKTVTAATIVKALSDFSGNKGHDRHIHYDECKKLGLDVDLIETDPILQDLVLTVHHCFMHSLTNTPAFKIIENHMGTAFVKQQQTIQIIQQQA